MKRWAISILLLISSEAVNAEPMPLGRLFLDPQQRAHLDLQRQRNPGYLPDSDDHAVTQTLNGVVRSSHGRSTHWVNGQADWQGSTPPPRVPVGDTINPSTGERESVLGDGRITIRRPTPRP